MAERRFPYTIAWLLFIVSILTGAGLLLSSDTTRQVLGLVLLFLPLLVFALLGALYYWKTRRDAARAMEEQT